MSRPDLPPELDAALAEHPDAEALRSVWHRLPVAAPADDVAARDAAWARLAARLADPARVPSPDDDIPVVPLRPVEARAATTRRWRAWAARAAVLGLAAFGAAVTWRAVPVSISAPAGGAPRQLTLADGSVVVLSPGSRVRVSRALGAAVWWRPDARLVRLEGQAFFAVARDGRPFAVRTDDAVVEVLGTRFDVRAAVAGAGTRVAVEEGHVAVSARRPAAGRAARTDLRAGDAVLVQAGVPVRLPPAAAPQVAAWRTGGLVAIDDPLAAVFADVARRAGIEITLDDAARAIGPVSLYYPTAPAPETVVADLATAHGLTFTRTSRGFAVTGAPSRR